MSTFNLRRGAIRIWIVMTVFWFALVAALGWSEFTNPDKSVLYYSSATDALYRSEYELPPDDRPRDDSLVATLIAPDGSTAINFAEYVMDGKKVIMLKSLKPSMDFEMFPLDAIPQSRKDRLLTNAMGMAASARNEQRLKISAIALIPPAALFVFGMLVRWILAGFVVKASPTRH